MDGQRVNPAYKNEDFGLATTGIDTVLMISAIRAKITFSGLMFSISLPYGKFNHNTEGQCGQSQFIFSPLSSNISHTVYRRKLWIFQTLCMSKLQLLAIMV